MTQQRNPRFWQSQWYSTKFAEEPWPGGWYWHDESYSWFGPYDSEHEAREALEVHETEAESEASQERKAPRGAVSLSLYYHPLSSYSQKVLIALYEKGFEFERNIVNLTDEEAREEYRKIYPMGKIPLLVLNHGPLIPESSIIVEYLDSLGGFPLISQDPDVARKTRFKDRMFDYLSDSIAALLFQYMKPAGERHTKKMETAQRRIDAAYEFTDNEIAAQEWANGDQFSLSDCSAAAALFYAPLVAPFDKHPNIKAYSQRLNSRRSVQRVGEEAEPYRAAYSKKLRD
jgi:glutathione S-transferase